MPPGILYVHFIPVLISHILQLCCKLISYQPFIGMKTDILLFGFKKPVPKLVRFKRRYFKLLEGFYEHLRVSRLYGMKKSSKSLRYYLEGTRRYLYAQGNTFKTTCKILRKLAKLAKQMVRQLQQFELLDSLGDFEVHNVTPLSLFGLVRKCEKPVTSSVILTKRKE